MESRDDVCIKLKRHLEKCLKLNIQVFGKENGVVMCGQLQSLYHRYCKNSI
jgi:hypothetical protein